MDTSVCTFLLIFWEIKCLEIKLLNKWICSFNFDTIYQLRSSKTVSIYPPLSDLDISLHLFAYCWGCISLCTNIDHLCIANCTCPTNIYTVNKYIGILCLIPLFIFYFFSLMYVRNSFVASIFTSFLAFLFPFSWLTFNSIMGFCLYIFWIFL